MLAVLWQPSWGGHGAGRTLRVRSNTVEMVRVVDRELIFQYRKLHQLVFRAAGADGAWARSGPAARTYTHHTTLRGAARHTRQTVLVT